MKTLRSRTLSLATGLMLVLSMFALLPAGAFNASADVEYELEVAGITVTDQNKDDILGNGEASYDPESKTLTVKKDIVCNSDNTEGATPCIVNRIGGLTVKGENGPEITREEFGAGIYTEKDMTLTGKMSITGGAALLASDCRLTIENADITAYGRSSGIQGGRLDQESTSALVIKNSKVSAVGEEEGAVICFDCFDLVDCDHSDVDWEFKNDRVVLAGETTTVIEIFFSNSPIYPLELAGRKVTEDIREDILGGGEASYDPAKNVLTLKKNITCDFSNTMGATPCICNRIGGLTINAEVPVALTREAIGAALYSEKDITLKGTMTVTGGGGIMTSGCNLTIEDADINASGDFGGIAGVMGGNRLVIRRSRVRAYGTENGAVSGFDQGIEIDDCAILTPGCIIDNGSIVDEEKKTAVDYAEITNSKIYDLRVAGVRVTEDNMDDILGNGEASYDPETNTLTLKKDITCVDENNTGCVENNIPGLTVKADERITLLRKNFGAAIVSGEDIVLTGKMDINGGAGIVILESQLTIKDADFNINGNGWGIMGGMAGDGSKLVIKNSKVNAKGTEDGAIVGFGEGIILEDSEMGSDDFIIKDGSICSVGGTTPASEATVIVTVLKGDVNGDGKVNLKDLVLLRRYLNKWGVEINKVNANMNDDQNINLKDLVLLQRKLNKWF